MEEESQEKKKNKTWKYKLVIAIIFIALIIAYIIFSATYKEEKTRDIFEDVEQTEASLTEYIVYGPHLRVKGNLLIDNIDIQDVNLCLRTINKKDLQTRLKYKNIDNGIEFYTSELINEGIDLEQMDVNEYYAIIEVEYLDGKVKYYSIKNETEYPSVEYYTITKNGQNNKIDIKFGQKIYNYMMLDVKNTYLPDDVYDIVIDAGHGGGDPGAEYSGYREADLALKCAKEVKNELEKLGLKVMITRDGTEGKEYNAGTVYKENGRVNIVGKSKAKYVFSIHLNSVEIPNSQSGVEIYAPPNMNLDFAKAFASNIVKYANTNYSTLDIRYKVLDGIYVRTFKEWEIKDSVQEAKQKGYEPYNITEGTTYLYMLRETGGIATGAYVDGRNTKYGKNLFYNSNIGLEAYLLEIGYINNTKDLNNILNNNSGYVNGIVQTIKEKLNIN